MNPKIAVIRDGYSDFLVVRKFIGSIFEKHHIVDLDHNDFYDLDGLNITNPLSKYITKASKEGHSLFGSNAMDYRRALGGILMTAVKKFKEEKNGELTNSDIVILNSDAEKVLGATSKYFADWSFSIGALTWFAIEEYYNKMTTCGTHYESLPLILPLIPFPSSEILVAPCIEELTEKDRQLKPNPDLKIKVYGSSDIPTIVNNGSLEQVLNEYVVPKNLAKIYRSLPEVRKVMQILTFAPSSS